MFKPAMFPEEKVQQAAWFLFDGDELLVTQTNEALLSEIPRYTTTAITALPIQSEMYLGTYQDLHLYAGSIEKHNIQPTETQQWLPFRQVLICFQQDSMQLANAAKQLLTWHQDNQFCSRCGHRLAAHAQERAKQCNACDYLCYPKISPCVIVLVHNRDHIVLAKAHRYQSQRYGLIAGYIEAGETAEQAAIREVKEEVGLNVKHCRYFATQSWPFPHLLMIGFFAEYSSGEIQIEAAELDDAKWFSIHSLPPLPSLGSIANKMIASYIHQHQSA